MNIDALIYDCNSRAKNVTGFWSNITYSGAGMGIGYSVLLTQGIAVAMRDIIKGYTRQ